MKIMGWILVLACALPALLIAIALGPVVVGLLCAVGCAALVAVVAYVLGVTAGSVERVAGRLTHRRSPS